MMMTINAMRDVSGYIRACIRKMWICELSKKGVLGGTISPDVRLESKSH